MRGWDAERIFTPEDRANDRIATEMAGALGDGDGFDIVFSDVAMPGMGGVELAKKLPRDLPKMPVILASGYSHVLAQEGTEGVELCESRIRRHSFRWRYRVGLPGPWFDVADVG